MATKQPKEAFGTRPFLHQSWVENECCTLETQEQRVVCESHGQANTTRQHGGKTARGLLSWASEAAASDLPGFFAARIDGGQLEGILAVLSTFL